MFKKIILFLAFSIVLTSCSGYNVNVNDRHVGTIESSTK